MYVCMYVCIYFTYYFFFNSHFWLFLYLISHISLVIIIIIFFIFPGYSRMFGNVPCSGFYRQPPNLTIIHTYIHNCTEVQVSRVIIVLLLQNCFVWFKDHTHQAILTTELLKLESWQLNTKI